MIGVHMGGNQRTGLSVIEATILSRFLMLVPASIIMALSFPQRDRGFPETFDCLSQPRYAHQFDENNIIIVENNFTIIL